MKEFRKWNYQKQDYDPYYVPDDKKLVLYSDDMHLVVNCCQCLKEIIYGDSYTSLEVHNSIGLGYPVCFNCYQEEKERRNLYDKN